jgi:hypothetical protein
MVLIPSGEVGIYENDYFVYDLLDPDIFLRARNELEQYVVHLDSSYPKLAHLLYRNRDGTH